MKFRIIWAVVLIFGAFLPSLQAALTVPPLTGRVVDRAQVFSPEGEAALEQAIRRLENATGGQMAVLTIPSLEGENLETFGIKVAEKWEIGSRKEANGAILLLAVRDRQMRLEIGYGWEGVINDARAGDIVRGMTGFLQDGDYDTAARYAVNRVEELVTGKPVADLPVPPRRAKEQDGGAGWGAIVFFIILLLIFSRSRGFFFFGGGGGGFRGGGGGFGGGGFRGGGGGFGGGGASGRW